MKKILLSSLLLLLSMSLFISCSDDDDDDIIIQSSELPQAAQNFVSTHFNGETYLRIEKDKKPDADGSLYEVYLSNGFKAEFDTNGLWVEVDGEMQPVPSSIIKLLPEAIPNYVKATYPAQYIVSIDKKIYGFNIELNYDLDLVFNHEGNFIGIDR